MQRDSDEDAWRAIVENYGDRAELEDEPSAESSADPSPEPSAGPATESATFLVEPLPVREPDDHPELRRPAYDDPEDRFVPPPPPPLPRLPPDRLLAWTGLFGSPTMLLVCLVFGISLPPWLGYLLVAFFIGGFVYLVVKMPRGPADPWDDGARL